jgi:hypothetical protein
MGEEPIYSDDPEMPDWSLHNITTMYCADDADVAMPPLTKKSEQKQQP